MTQTLGKLLGLEDVAAIDGVRLALAAPWAERSAFWVVLVAALGLVASVVFYLRGQKAVGRPARVLLGACRGLLLVLLIVTLADPVVELGVVHRQRPLVAVLFDGTESMAIEDDYPAEQRQRISAALEVASRDKRSRLADVQALLGRRKDLFAEIESRGADVEAYSFEGTSTSKVRKLSGAESAAAVARQLAARGQVTALGAALEELAEQAPSRLAAVVVVSDFAHNAGLAPLGEAGRSPAMALGAPIYAVGVGATDAIDLAVELQTDLRMKKAERGSIFVKLRQSGLAERTADVKITARALGGEGAAAGGGPREVGRRQVKLTGELETVEFPFVPEEAGRFEFLAEVTPLAGEATVVNNRSERQVNIIDDYLRLMYVAYEPTWEWRFIKEVFHRDKLVGMSGFRTFLTSSDPRVRESNVLFLPTLTPSRSAFFASDVLFLDDMPRSALPERFGELTKEFVGNLGGGLVVIAGPRFGPGELYNTAIADMLPVIIDPQADLKTAPAHSEFTMRLTPQAARFPFMQLEARGSQVGGWRTLGKLPWYQPVAMPHPQAEVLAEHPTDVCADGRTPQPLVAIRKYGKGEVVYLGFNEMWRLRKEHGEQYYRQFWSQLIYRLGMSHALGADKRFVVRLDQPQYRPYERVTVSVEAYDENYEPLAIGQGLAGELVSPGEGGAVVQPVTIPLVHPGMFEARVPVTAAGSYSIRVRDPVTGKASEQRFEVTGLSVERRRAVRDARLQEAIAQATGGRSYDLTTVDRMPADLKLRPIEQRLSRHVTLWATPLWFGTIVALMLGEWAARKWMRLA